MVVVRCTWVLALVLGIGCQSGAPACPGFCLANTPVAFTLACAPTDVTNVTVSGPCLFGDAAPSTFVPDPRSTSIPIGSASPGVCHVTIAFATGFTYSADVTFVSQTQWAPAGCNHCAPYVTPTQPSFTVNNPSSTCVDAGPDAGQDAPAD